MTRQEGSTYEEWRVEKSNVDVMKSIVITGRKAKPGVAKMPTGISPEGDPNNQIGETRSGGKNSPQALIFFSSWECVTKE